MQPATFNHSLKCNKDQPFKYNSGTTAYIGRSSNLAKLQEFLDTDCQYPAIWWVITGLGGSGKSRIMHEIAIKNKMRWQVELIQDEAEINIDNLNRLLHRSSKNLLLIFDTYISNFANIAAWIKKRNNQFAISSFPKIRIVFLRREIGTWENIPPEWVNSMLEKDLDCMYYLYKQSILHLDALCEEDICKIIKSYLMNVYPKCKYEERDLHLLAQTQTDMNLMSRPLFSMFLADAYANEQTPFNWDEERILQYTYKREKQIIFEQYEQAFKITPMDYPKVFECIENLYAAATITGRKMDNIYNERFSFFREMIKATHLDKDIITQRMQSYGILQDGNLTVIEPDIVGEYFVLQRYLSLETVYTDWDFYIKFFRDLYKILNSKHMDIVTEILTYDTGAYWKWHIQ